MEDGRLTGLAGASMTYTELNMFQDNVLTVLSNVPLGKWNVSEIQYVCLCQKSHVFACVCFFHSFDGLVLECLVRSYKYSCSFLGCVPFFTTLD